MKDREKEVKYLLKAVIVGATGVVGKELVRVLLNTKKYDKITIIARRRLSIVHPRLEQQVIQFDHIQDCKPEWFQQADVYCALGTTIKTAGSREQFEKVDFHYVYEIGRLVQKYNARKYIVISAVLANEQSKIFYTRVKGKIERALESLQLPQLIILRPSLIVGERNEFRLGEWTMNKLFNWLPFLFKGKMKRYKPNRARDIAMAMYKLAVLNKEKHCIVEAEQIEHWAKQKVV